MSNKPRTKRGGKNKQAPVAAVVEHAAPKASARDVSRPWGVTGLKARWGVVYEEWLPELKGTKAAKIFQQMEDDAVIGTLLDSIRTPLMAAEFTVTPASDSEADQNAADFFESCMSDMTRYSWRQHVLDMLTFLTFGYSLHEVVLKKRMGPNVVPSSKFTDGKLGLHILDPRGQDTVVGWTFDDEQNVTEVKQRVEGQDYTIPMWKVLHSTWRSRKRNPEGKSPLRSLYRAWRRKDGLEEIEAIGIERDMAGLPVITLPQGATSEDADTAEAVVRNLRMDEEAGVVLPGVQAGQEGEGWKLELMGGGGSKSYDADKTIQRYTKMILMRLFAQFLMLGMENAGTQALVKGSHDFFSLALVGVQQEMLEVWNDQLVPLLFRFNPFPGITGLPKLDWSPPGKTDIESMVNVLEKLVNSEIITPGVELEDWMRTQGDMPDRPEGVGEGPRTVEPPLDTGNMDFVAARQKEG